MRLLCDCLSQCSFSGLGLFLAVKWEANFYFSLNSDGWWNLALGPQTSELFD